jgi:broad specificity phosphatase PhoE
MKLYLIRHGQPELSEYSGFPGPKLGAKGQQQALEICNILKTKNIQSILSSDYARVTETTLPILNAIPGVCYSEIVELRERENDIESHESLVQRVQSWFTASLKNVTQQNTAIFGHCGSINMILFHLDPNLKKMSYPFEDKYKCLTPIGGIWELTFENNEFRGGQLIFNGQLGY